MRFIFSSCLGLFAVFGITAHLYAENWQPPQCGDTVPKRVIINFQRDFGNNVGSSFSAAAEEAGNATVNRHRRTVTFTLPADFILNPSSQLPGGEQENRAYRAVATKFLLALYRGTGFCKKGCPHGQSCEIADMVLDSAPRTIEYTGQLSSYIMCRCVGCAPTARIDTNNKECAAEQNIIEAERTLLRDLIELYTENTRIISE